MYAEAAVDGSVATVWAVAPADAGGSLTVDLGARKRVSRVTPRWTDVLPATYQVLVSVDGTRWTQAPAADVGGVLQHPVNARYLRVDLTRAAGAGRTGLKELEVA
jgi:F5/8 type C domain